MSSSPPEVPGDGPASTGDQPRHPRLQASRKRSWSVRLRARVLKWFLSAVDPPVETTSLNASSEDQQYEDLLARGLPGWLRRLLQPRAALDRYRRLEEWSWKSGSEEIQNLAWLLRAKHEESVARGRSMGFIGFLGVLVGAVLGLFIFIWIYAGPLAPKARTP